MRQLAPDRKRFLIAQHRKSSTPNPSPLRPPKSDPASSQEQGALAGLKRFSMASVGWVAASEEPNAAAAKPPPRPFTTFEHPTPPSPSQALTSSLEPPSNLTSSPSLGETPQSASTWTSWWASASNATGSGHAVGEQAKDTPPFYVDQLRSR